MATLRSDNWTFDIRYAGWENGWLCYQFWFRWKGENVVKESVLKRWTDYWNVRPEGAFLANEHQHATLLPWLRHMVDSDVAGRWEPVEPDLMVCVYPPGAPSSPPRPWVLLRESEESKRRGEERDLARAERGTWLPDDIFAFVARVDSYNFKDADAYGGGGLALEMLVERQELEHFADELETEYREICQQPKGGEDWDA